LYIADEAFICGTGAEIQAIRDIDHFTIGNGGIGPVVAKVEQLYHDVVRGRGPKHEAWLTGVF
ncbi:MAG: branched chain amino acid aminotransferase, partial [Dehalococcoidia bacterium]